MTRKVKEHNHELLHERKMLRYKPPSSPHCDMRAINKIKFVTWRERVSMDRKKEEDM